MIRTACLILLIAVAACRATQPAALYVDVRTPAEYASDHVRGALNIPVTEIEQRWREIADRRQEPVVVYCRSGRRSAIAVAYLREKGFTRVEDGGALARLRAAGIPLE